MVAGATLATAGLHWATPAGPHTWHWAHLVAAQLYYVPILLAAAWFSRRGVAYVTIGVSALQLLHILLQWRGHPMVQAEQVASVATFWLIAAMSSWLFGRIRAALEGLRAAHEETLTALASSLELRERYTAGHSERVRDYSLKIAENLSIRDPAELSNLAAGARFHDIGKIGIPDEVLLKEAPLEGEDWNVLRRHPELGAALIGRIPFLSRARELVLSHHEKFDGTGYPRGLAGEKIPLGARIFSVADAFDAMTTTRPYRKAIPIEEARRAISAGKGRQFDPCVVEAFLAMPVSVLAEITTRHGGRGQEAEARPVTKHAFDDTWPSR